MPIEVNPSSAGDQERGTCEQTYNEGNVGRLREGSVLREAEVGEVDGQAVWVGRRLGHALVPRVTVVRVSAVRGGVGRRRNPRPAAAPRVGHSPHAGSLGCGP